MVCVIWTRSLVFILARRVMLSAALARPLAQRPNLVKPLFRGAFSLVFGALGYGGLGGRVSDSGRSGIVTVSCRKLPWQPPCLEHLNRLQLSRL